MILEIPEFSRRFAIATIGTVAQPAMIEADEDERGRLATRFNLISIDYLAVRSTLVLSGAGIIATGQLTARVTQRCVATEEAVEARLNEFFSICFVPTLEGGDSADELEITADECDYVEHDGVAIDLGEASAQTLALALNPFPRAQNATKTLQKAGVMSESEVIIGPFAALRALKKPT